MTILPLISLGGLTHAQKYSSRSIHLFFPFASLLSKLFSLSLNFQTAAQSQGSSGPSPCSPRLEPTRSTRLRLRTAMPGARPPRHVAWWLGSSLCWAQALPPAVHHVSSIDRRWRPHDSSTRFSPKIRQIFHGFLRGKFSPNFSRVSASMGSYLQSKA